MELTKRSLAGVALLGPFAARAQARPSRPVRIVVPTGAGGITDILARMVGQRLAERLGQPVVIDNRPGADGIVGTEAAARAAPDGHTLLMVFPSHTLNPALRRTSLFFDTPITALPMLRDGRLRALGVTTAARNPALPDVPTVVEAGLPGFDVESWNGLLAPAGTPRPIVERLSEDLRAILGEPEVRARLAEQGADPAPTTPDAFARRVRDDLARIMREG